MLISVVTVTKNGGAAVLQTAQSVLAQGRGNWEYLVKDGLSTDGTPALLRAFGVEVLQQRDAGIYHAMNQALLAARGDYVYFLNAGDRFVDRRVLSRLSELIDRRAGIVYGEVLRVPQQQPLAQPARLTRRTLYLRNLCHQGWLVQRRAALQLGGFRAWPLPGTARQPIAADQELLWRVLWQLQLPAQRVPLRIAEFRHGGFSTQRAQRAAVRRERRQLERLWFAPGERLRWTISGATWLQPLKARIWDLRYDR